jgi:hypothetical protein
MPQHAVVVLVVRGLLGALLVIIGPLAWRRLAEHEHGFESPVGKQPPPYTKSCAVALIECPNRPVPDTL